MEAKQNRVKYQIGMLMALAIGALVVTVLTTAPAFADSADEGIMPLNTEDHPVDFSLNFWQSSDWTPAEWKEDYTSTYVFSNVMNINQCRLEVWGSTAWNGNFVNRTDQGYATLRSRGEFLIDQWVKENGEGWAMLKGVYNGHDGSLSGKWSADSIDYGFDHINGENY